MNPNILFVFPDQHRGDWMGENASLPLRTPNLQNLSTWGVRFTNAVTPSPLCAPARACIALGQEYQNCDTPDNDCNMPLDRSTFYSLLRDKGYHVAGCGKFDLHKKDLDWGLDGKRLLHEWGFSDGIDNEGKYDGMKSGAIKPMGPYLNYLDQQGARNLHVEDFRNRKADGGWDAEHLSPLTDEQYCDNWIGRNALQLLSEVPVDKPWFLQINFAGPHAPYDITESMNALYRDEDFTLPEGEEKHSLAQLEKKYRSYAAMIENIDRWVGIFIETLKERGELENTLIVFSSDHGEMLGEQNRWGKSVPYHPSVHVPLIISGPGYLKDTVCSNPVTILDLTATFLEAADIQVPESMDCRSVIPILQGKADKTREYVTSALERQDEFTPWRMVFDGRYKYIDWQGERMLFDLDTDSGETVNIVNDNGSEAGRLEALLPKSIRPVGE